MPVLGWQTFGTNRVSTSFTTTTVRITAVLPQSRDWANVFGITVKTLMQTSGTASRGSASRRVLLGTDDLGLCNLAKLAEVAIGGPSKPFGMLKHC